MSDNREHVSAPHGESEEAHAEAIHLPGPSYWPFVLSVLLVVAVGGLIVSPLITAVGALASLAAIIAWGLEDTSK